MKRHLPSSFLIAIASMGLVGCTSMNHKDREEAISLSSTPAAVQAMAHRVAGENRIEKVTKETEDGQVVFEIEFDVSNVDHSATISPSGELIEEESDATFESFPSVVQSAVKTKYPDAKVKECAIEKRQGKMIYEVQIESAQHRREIKMTADGAIQLDKLTHEDEHDKD